MLPSIALKRMPRSLMFMLLSMTSHALHLEHLPLATRKLDSRRQWIINSGQAVTAAAFSVGVIDPARAFENAIPDAKQFESKIKQPGDQPADLGMAVRDLRYYGSKEAVPALKACTEDSPNCFSTTGRPQLDADHLVAPWRPPVGYSADKAARDLEAVVRAYKPGQAGIDGGGFKVITSSASGAESAPGALYYLYAQFESLRQGYIDDVEFSIVPSSNRSPGDSGALEVLLRSSSRLGYLDFAVNAMRLNYIAARLRDKGWTALAIDRKSHQDYFYQNSQH